MQHIFIINPIAGKIDSTKWISKAINTMFMNHSIEGTYRIENTKAPKDATDIARKYAESNEETILYACGGDGTLNEVLNGIIGFENVTLAHLPVGTGNDFIKTFGPHAYFDFLKLEELVHGNTVLVDVIECANIYAINIANIGMDARIAEDVTKFKRIPLVNGKGAYNLSLAYNFFTSTSNHMKIQVDGVEESETNYTFSVFANGRYYGGSYCAAPFSNMQDGLLDIVLIPHISRAKILKFMNIYQNGTHLDGTHEDIIRFKQGRQVQIIAPHPVTVCLDGENYKLKNPLIEVHKQKIKLLVPKQYTSAEQLCID